MNSFVKSMLPVLAALVAFELARPTIMGFISKGS